MKKHLVVTITCPDRPGIVERITEHVINYSANWEDSRMARLGGHFAGIVLISVPQEKVEALTQSLLELADDDTTVAVKATQDVPPVQRSEDRLFDFSLTGADHEGIVHRVAAYLADQGINVESMETNVVPAPMSASPLFHMTAMIKAPADLALDELVARLNDIGDEAGVDIHVRSII